MALFLWIDKRQRAIRCVNRKGTFTFFSESSKDRIDRASRNSTRRRIRVFVFLLQRANIFLSRQETETRLKNSSGAVGGGRGGRDPPLPSIMPSKTLARIAVTVPFSFTHINMQIIRLITSYRPFGIIFISMFAFRVIF